MTDLTPRAVLRNCTLARRLPLASPPAARLGSLENGSQLPLVALATFSTVLAFLTISALATLLTFSPSGLAPALALTFAFRVAFAIARWGDDRLPNS